MYNENMAKNILHKLNTLVRASVKDLVSFDLPSLNRLGKNLDSEIASLRQQLEAAYTDETALQGRLAHMDEEILSWDTRADQALINKQDAQARYALQQMETLKQRRTMLASDLQEHQRATHELLIQITELETLLKSSQGQPATEPVIVNEPTLSDAIRRARQQTENEKTASSHLQMPEESVTIDEEAIEKDLAVRRSRLAKPEA
jgi:phage shock protein A